ncbi:MAG: response regulator transcription factor [Gammaproteobacteria bacterium]|nr:response regulator transcription factor [Gammaproteobacteria bacterium]
MNIALLEDDQDQAILIAEWLLQGGHICNCFQSGDDFTYALKNNTYDLLLIDWVVPDMSGIDALHWVREHIEWRIPILFITKMDREEDIVQALNEGADDYMSKPIRQKELIARIEALHRRATNDDQKGNLLEYKPYTINREQRCFQLNDSTISMTHIEFDLAVFMFRNQGRVLSREYILRNVWGKNSEISTRTVDTHMSRIRKKLHIGPDNGWKLTPVYQHGYRLDSVGSDEG